MDFAKGCARVFPAVVLFWLLVFLILKGCS
jgi:hypothetical protein